MNVRRWPTENPRHLWLNGEIIYDIRPGRGRVHLSISQVRSPSYARVCGDLDPCKIYYPLVFLHHTHKPHWINTHYLDKDPDSSVSVDTFTAH